ncbi:MAG: hypothetical protein ACLSX0_01605 [Anaerostipes caccae]|jgi:hypothetical protein
MNNAELLGVRKLVYSPKSKISRIAFPFEDYQTPLFFYEKDDGVLLAKKQLENNQFLTKRTVGRLSNQVGYYTYLNMYQIFDEPCHYSILQDEKGYFIRKSTKDEEEALAQRKKGVKTKNKGYVSYLGSARFICIPTEMDMRLRGNPQKPYLTCSLSFEGERYMKITPVKTLDGIPKETEAAHIFGGLTYFYRAKQPVTFQYLSKRHHGKGNHCYRMPIAFYRAMRLKEGDPVFLRFLEDGSLVMTAELHCDICGDSIDTYQEKLHTVCASKEVHQKIPVIRKSMQEHSDLSHEKRFGFTKEVQKEIIDRLEVVEATLEKVFS